MNDVRDFFFEYKGDKNFTKLSNTGIESNYETVFEFTKAYYEYKLTEVNKLALGDVSVSLRDYIATECMKSEIIAWNKEMGNEYRAKLLEDMIERYGNIKVNNAIALMSYEMADAMLSARSNER